MSRFFKGLSLVCVVVALIPACTDPTIVGAELLEQDQVGSGFTDTLTIIGRTVRGDTVSTYAPTLWPNNFLCGQLTDPIFGKSTVSIYGQPLLNRSLLDLSIIEPDFFGAILDSIYLVLPFTRTGHYGPNDQPITLEVLELSEPMNRTAYYNSDTDFPTQAVPLGSLTFVPNRDSLAVIDYSLTQVDTVRFSHIRIPLSEEFGRRLIRMDTAALQSDTLFYQRVKGIQIRPVMEGNSVLSFDLSPAQGASIAGIYLYYRKDDMLKQYYFPFTFFSAMAVNFQYDYAGSFVAPFIEKTEPDSLVFLQGGRGLFVELEFPHLEKFKGEIVVNKAELELTVANLPGDDPDLYLPVEQILPTYLDEDAGDFRYADDVLQASTRVASVVGGFINKGTNGRPDVYRINITSHFQKMIDGEKNNILYLQPVRFIEQLLAQASPFLRAERINRAAFYSPNHSQYPIKINLTFTKRIR